MNWKGCGRRRSWHNVGTILAITWRGLRKTAKTNLGQDSRSPGRDFNQGPPEYEAGVLTTRPRPSTVLGFALEIYCQALQ
jgi:hypothetical protein